MTAQYWLIGIGVLLLLIILRDIFLNKRHTIQHNFPLVGHIRYFLESIGPELRQYIVANNREELPFNRIRRAWVYASAKNQNNYQGFGTDMDIYRADHIFINPSMFPFRMPEAHINWQDPAFLPSAKVIGKAWNRKKPFRPYSIVNISAMSYGSLSARAVESMNKGALRAGVLHNTGEGGVSPYHQKGADLIFQIGTGYFGVRDEHGNFDMERLVDLVAAHPQIRAIELKLSQGAKPGKGGVLPKEKISREIAHIRGVPQGKDVISPAYHKAFGNLEEMLDLIEKIAERTGLPVGIKAAVGQEEPWERLAQAIKSRGTGPDYISVDGGEGGTGAAPPSFAGHVALPFIYAFREVYKIFQRFHLSQDMVFFAAGRLGYPASALMAMAMGVDIIYIARESMFSIGCIQAQQCHTNSCPTGVATQNPWLQKGINVEDKAQRLANYMQVLRKEILEVTHACGYEHPAQMTMRDVEISMADNHTTKMLEDVLNYQKTPVDFMGMDNLARCPQLKGVVSDEAKKAMEKYGQSFYSTATDDYRQKETLDPS